MENRTFWTSALFWGAAWGLAEATLGFVLHLPALPSGLAGAVLFPVGAWCMVRAARGTGTPAAALALGPVAAALKLMDLALPGADPFAVANPVAAILLQSLAVGAVLRLWPMAAGRLGALTGLTTAIGWRTGYALLLAAAASLAPLRGILDHGAAGVSRFLLLEGVVNALLIGLFMELDRRLSDRWPRFAAAPHPAAAVALTALAVAAGRFLP
ncbi:MAG TPA: hypothetical protein PLY66_02605 [Acidobacteriota bacterium]|nr:hypothetical protein [Acidobacteriota bacterium]HQF88222.1 hypothetical protein [Acidobacteriota bacterium]HQG92359.1 hypothetical protein [Acidobacteriota bacterium]HQK88109.1 hypothetical protein [Acidobacteriota bacterium]